MNLDQRAGAHLTRPPGPKYSSSLSFAELSFPSTLPKASTLRKWRESLPDGFEIALQVPDAVLHSGETPFSIDPAGEAFAWLAAAAEVLEPHFVFATGKKISTSSRHKQQILALVEALPTPEEREAIWVPGGLWEAEYSYPFAAQHGITCAFDPGRDDPPPSELAYARIRGMGKRKRVSDGVLWDIADLLGMHPYVRVVVESDRSHAEAEKLQRLFAGE